MDLILTEPVANQVVVVDEMDKAGTARSDKGRSFDLAAALAPLPEALGAKNWTCPYLPDHLVADLERSPAAPGPPARPMSSDPPQAIDIGAASGV